jgi:hypothetical protein
LVEPLRKIYRVEYFLIRQSLSIVLETVLPRFPERKIVEFDKLANTFGLLENAFYLPPAVVLCCTRLKV